MQMTKQFVSKPKHFEYRILNCTPILTHFYLYFEILACIVKKYRALENLQKIPTAAPKMEILFMLIMTK